MRITLCLIFLFSCASQFGRAPASNTQSLIKASYFNNAPCAEMLYKLIHGEDMIYLPVVGSIYRFTFKEPVNNSSHAIGYLVENEKSKKTVTIWSDGKYLTFKKDNFYLSLTQEVDRNPPPIRLETVNTFKKQVTTVENVIGIKPFRNGMFHLSDIIPEFNAAKDIAIGLDNTSNHHMYLMVDGMRFDGLVFKKAYLNQHAMPTESGIVFQIKDIGEEKVQSLRQYLANSYQSDGVTNIFTGNCYEGVCKVLREGANLELANKHSFWGTTIFKSLVKDGVYSEGEKLEMRVFTTANHTLKERYNDLRKLQVSLFYILPRDFLLGVKDEVGYQISKYRKPITIIIILSTALALQGDSAE